MQRKYSNPRTNCMRTNSPSSTKSTALTFFAWRQMRTQMTGQSV